MSEAIAKRAFLVSLVFLAAAVLFGYGFAVERYQVWPYEVIHQAARMVKNYAEFGESIPEGRRIRAPENASREIFTIHDRNRLEEGFYVFAGWNDEIEQYGAWLYDHRGRLLHTWHFDYYEFDPDGPLNGEEHPHPVYPMQDGSLLVAFDSGDILVRVDTCSEARWVKHGVYHHSLARAEDGSFWTWRGDGTPYGHYHYIENFDPESGATLRDIRLVEDIIANAGDQSAIFGVRPDFPWRRWERNPVFLALNDIFHPNDVEVLSSEMAPAFPMFAPGDLLISLRNIDLVAVLDAQTLGIKWWSQGPWRSQHDPDFTSDGRISVFSNNPDRGRSEILIMDPGSMEFSNDLFDGEVSFYTGTMGKHQYLANGNVLIVVPDEGRVLEVSPSGSLVMEFNNLAPGSSVHNDHVQDAMWLPAGYFPAMPSCSR